MGREFQIGDRVRHYITGQVGTIKKSPPHSYWDQYVKLWEISWDEEPSEFQTVSVGCLRPESMKNSF